MALGNLWHILLATATAPGHTQAHHARRKNKGPAGTDKAAHKPAHKSYGQQKGHGNGREHDKLGRVKTEQIHVTSGWQAAWAYCCALAQCQTCRR
jgi:hypothetical protein